MDPLFPRGGTPGQPMRQGSRISEHDGDCQTSGGRWWFWQEPYRIAGHEIAGSWVGPFDDRDEAEGAMASSDSDDAQARSEAERNERNR